MLHVLNRYGVSKQHVHAGLPSPLEKMGKSTLLSLKADASEVGTDDIVISAAGPEDVEAMAQVLNGACAMHGACRHGRLRPKHRMPCACVPHACVLLLLNAACWVCTQVSMDAFYGRPWQMGPSSPWIQTKATGVHKHNCI